MQANKMPGLKKVLKTQSRLSHLQGEKNHYYYRRVLELR